MKKHVYEKTFPAAQSSPRAVAQALREIGSWLETLTVYKREEHVDILRADRSSLVVRLTFNREDRDG